jgi:hypothetical protein
MAKRAAKKSKKTKKAAAKSAAKPRRMARPTPPDEHSHIDCCDVDFTAGELTADADLPAARFGRIA